MKTISVAVFDFFNKIIILKCELFIFNIYNLTEPYNDLKVYSEHQAETVEPHEPYSNLGQQRHSCLNRGTVCKTLSTWVTAPVE